MSCLSTRDLIFIREKVETDLSDAALEQLADDLETTDWQRVALSVIRSTLAKLRNRPAQWSLSGDYAEQWHQNITSLERKEHELAAALGEPTTLAAPALGVSDLERADRPRMYDLR